MAKEGRFDRFCTICGKHYEYCPTCSRFDHMERWHDAYCSEDCKNLYNITAGWVNGWKDKDIEIERLKNIDLSRYEYYPQWLKNVIKEMKLYEQSKEVDKKEELPDENNMTENTVVVESVKVDAEPIKVEEKHENRKVDKKNYNYKKNYKK